jgi:predicted alpha/beta-fold hydrolase
VQVDEVGLDSSLGEEAEGLPRIGAFLYSEDLNFHETRGGCVTWDGTCRTSQHCVGARSVADSNKNKFTPAWWLPGPHAQTLWSPFFRRRDARVLRHERLDTPDGDHVHLYHHDISAGRPRLLLLHGLEGSSRSHYVSGFVAQAARRGWSTTVLVFRGCGPELNVAPRLYHSGETTDLRLVVETLIDRPGAAGLFVAGVSLGGNVLLKYLGESGSDAPAQLVAAATVSVPYDLEPGCRALQRGFARVYDRHFLRSLREKAFRKLAQHPGLFDATKLASARTIEDFDNAVTGPVHGFSGSHEYYERSSSISYLAGIRIPTLLLSAADDPFLPREVLDRVRRIAQSNAFLTLQFTDAGGHVGFVSGSTPFRPHHWAEERLLAFFDSVQEPGAPAARAAAV